MQDKKVVLIFPFNLLSHYLRCLVMAERYFDRDEYEVCFLHSDQYDLYVHRAGYRTFACRQFDTDKVMADSRRFAFSWLNEQAISAVFLSQVECIRNFKPQLVIGDVAPTLKMAAELTEVRFISLLNGYMTPYCDSCRSMPTGHPAYRYLSWLPGGILNPLTAWGEARSFRKIHKPFCRLRERYNLKPLRSYLEEMQGDENLICDLPSLFPQLDLPDNYRITGPLIYRDAMPDNSWLEALDLSKPLIFVSMGSTGDWERLRFLNSAKYSAFTVITAGDTAGVLQGDHILAQPFVDIACVLEVADLMICHGGNGTIYHGLQSGVFMLCLTSLFEQEWNVKALERVGYGLSADGFTEKEWWEEINRSKGRKMKPFFEEVQETSSPLNPQTHCLYPFAEF